MRTIQQLTTLGMFLLTLGAASARAQENGRYNEDLRNGDALLEREQYDQALQAYKHAFGVSKKTSIDAALGMAMTYRALGAYKNVLDVTAEALKLAGGDKIQQAKIHNLRGAALVGLTEKPNDKRLQEAETEFRTALADNQDLYAARLNLGVTLLKMDRDEEGVRELKAYVERAPKGPDTREAASMIEDPRRARERFAPDFSFITLHEEYIALDDLKGKTVLLDFWGSWCPPCMKSTPGLIKLQKIFAEEPVVFLGIAKDKESDWRAYIDKHHLQWPQYLDETNKMIHKFGIRGYPTFIVLDGDGIIRARASGYGSGTDRWIESEIRKTLKKKN